MKSVLRSAVPLLLSCLPLAAALPDDTAYTALLRQHVREGLVDYAALKGDVRLDAYLGQIAATDPAAFPSAKARFAYWINAYNAYTLKLVAEHYPISSINDLATGGRYAAQLIGKTPWDIRFADAGGRKLTLNEIEHEILRKEFKDARLHFAIVCAALSCPILRSEAYVPERLDEQLDLQGRWFFRWRNRFDPETKQATLSKIFDWFAEDFGANQTELLRFVAAYAPAPIAASLSAEPEKWKLNYTFYDWGLNERRAQP